MSTTIPHDNYFYNSPTTNRPQTTSNSGKSRIGYSAAPRPRIRTAKPLFIVKDPKFMTANCNSTGSSSYSRPLTCSSNPFESGSDSALPRIQQFNNTMSSTNTRSIIKTIELENDIVQSIEFEFPGLNGAQRDCVLQVLYQSQIVREKFECGIRDIEWFADKDDILESLDTPAFPVDDVAQVLPEIEADCDVEPTSPSEHKLSSRPFSHTNLSDPSKEHFVVLDNGDRIDSDYMSKIKKVTEIVQVWVEQTLDTSVDLEEYINTQILGLPTAVPAILTKKSDKKGEGEGDQGLDPSIPNAQIPTTKNPPPTISGFQSDLEAALTSWKPQFLNTKKGRMLNVISESMAPTSVLNNLSKTYGINLCNRTLMRDPALTISQPPQKLVYGRWYLQPSEWSTHLKKQQRPADKLGGGGGTVNGTAGRRCTSFVQDKLNEINDRIRDEDDLLDETVPCVKRSLTRVPRSSIYGGKTSICRDKTGVIESRMSVNGGRKGLICGRTSVIGGRSSVNGDRASVIEDKTNSVSIPPLPYGKSIMKMDGKRLSFFMGAPTNMPSDSDTSNQYDSHNNRERKSSCRFSPIQDFPQAGPLPC